MYLIFKTNISRHRRTIPNLTGERSQIASPPYGGGSWKSDGILDNLLLYEIVGVNHD